VGACARNGLQELLNLVVVANAYEDALVCVIQKAEFGLCREGYIMLGIRHPGSPTWLDGTTLAN
jgi:hypothetical protein